MIISKTNAVKLFVSLGYKSAMNWDDEKIQKRINTLQNVAENKSLSVDKELEGLLERVLNSGDIEVIDDSQITEDVPDEATSDENEVEDEVAEKEVDVDGEKTTIEEKVAREFVEDSKAVAPKKERKKREPKKVGVIAFIVDVLKKGPTDKISIWNGLVEAFPERDSAAMKRTVQSAVPSGLRTIKKIDVKKTNDGKFYIEE
jgi:hypothetical protein